MYFKKYHIHFVGIGGIGMSGIAELLLNLGYAVSGSDIKSSDITRRLQRLGGVIYRGHSEKQITGADVVVVSSAVRSDNPEIMAAQNASIPVIPRAEMLAELMRLKYSVAVAGAHGKTSTTSIIASVLGNGGLDPTVVIGGKLNSIDSNALLGQGDFIVAEADESDGSFLKMSPTIAVVTNIDREHLDFYPDLDAIKDSFLKFIDSVPFYGLAVLCLDNESIQDLMPKIRKRFTTYGMTTQADFQARNVTVDGLGSTFDLIHQGQDKGRIRLNLAGVHRSYGFNAAQSLHHGTVHTFAVAQQTDPDSPLRRNLFEDDAEPERHPHHHDRTDQGSLDYCNQEGTQGPEECREKVEVGQLQHPHHTFDTPVNSAIERTARMARKHG